MIDRPRHLHAVTPTDSAVREFEAGGCAPPIVAVDGWHHEAPRKTVEEQWREDAARVADTITAPYLNRARSMFAYRACNPAYVPPRTIEEIRRDVDTARDLLSRSDDGSIGQKMADAHAGLHRSPSRARAFEPLAPVPEWARFTAIDGDGALWAYSERPRLEADCWAPWSMSSRIELLGYVEPSSAWRGSLLDLRDYTANRILYVENDDASARTAFLWVLGGIVGLIGLVIGASAAGWLPVGWL